MQFDASMVISVLGAILAAAGSIIMVLGKATAQQHVDGVNQRLAELSKKHDDMGARFGGHIDALRAENHQLVERLHRAEMTAMELRGAITLVKQESDASQTDVATLEERMVSRAEVKALESMLQQTLNEVRSLARGGTGRYASTPVPAPTIAPPRPERR